MFLFVANASVPICGAGDALSKGIMLGIPSLLVVMVSDVNEGMHFRSELHSNRFAYESFASFRQQLQLKAGSQPRTT